LNNNRRFPGINQRFMKHEKIYGIQVEIWQAIVTEVKRAETKFPGWPTDMIHAAAIVAEEAGELSQAALKWTYEGGDIIAAQKEATQVAVTAIRFLKAFLAAHYEPRPCCEIVNQ